MKQALNGVGLETPPQRAVNCCFQVRDYFLIGEERTLWSALMTVLPYRIRYIVLVESKELGRKKKRIGQDLKK